jgi:flagellar basal body-associated protein FliL
MPDDDDFGGFGDEDGGGDSGSSEPSESSGGGLKRFLSGAVLRILMFVAAGIGVIIISVITASIVSSGSDEKREAVRGMAALETRTPAWAGYDLEEFRVATADRDSSHFITLRLSLAYEPGNMGVQTELTERRRQIRDLIILTLNSKEKDELHTPRQKEDLKSELVRLVNGLLQHGQIQDIFFQEIMIH